MNEKHIVLVMKNDGPQQRPSPVNKRFISKSPDTKADNDAFVVDWQMEAAGTLPEDIFPGPPTQLAGRQTNGRKQFTLTFVQHQLKTDK